MTFKPFLKPRIIGPRFQGGAIPLEVLSDFAALSEMILEVAKWKCREDNPSRHRVPRGLVLSPQSNVVSQFFEYFFKLPSSLLMLTAHSRGLTKDRLRLYYDDFSRMTIRCPGANEQRRIADCLSSLDGWIAAESKKLAMLKTNKQGLMQQLFPSPEDS